jgi:hypothetical protein
MDLRKIICKEGKWKQFIVDGVQLWAFVLVVLIPRVLLPERYVASVWVDRNGKMKNSGHHERWRLELRYLQNIWQECTPPPPPRNAT